MKDNKQLEIILESILISDPYFYDENILTDFMKNKVFDKIKSYMDRNKDEIVKLNRELKSEKNLGNSEKGQKAINAAINKNWNSLTGDSLEFNFNKFTTAKTKSFADLMINIYSNLIKRMQKESLELDSKALEPQLSSFNFNEINGKYVYDEKVTNVIGNFGVKIKVAISAFLISLVIWTVLGNSVGATEKFLPEVKQTFSDLVGSVTGKTTSAQMDQLLVDGGSDAKAQYLKLKGELPTVTGVPETDLKIDTLKKGKTGLTPDQEKVIDEEIDKYEAIKDNLQKETKLKIKSLETEEQIYDSIKKISKTNKKEAAKALEKAIAKKIHDTVSEKIKSAYTANEVVITDLEPLKRATSLDDVRARLKANPEEAKRVIRKLKIANEKMAEYNEKITKFDENDSTTYIALGFTHRQLQLCAVVNAFEKFEQEDGKEIEAFSIDCTNLVDSNGKLVPFDSLEKSIGPSPELENMFRKKIADFEAIGLIDLSNKLQEAFDGKKLTDEEYEKIKEKIDKEVKNKSSKLSQKYSDSQRNRILRFWDTVYAVASGPINSIKNQPSKAKDNKYEDKLSDSEFRLKEIHNYFASGTDLWKSYNDKDKTDEQLATYFNLAKGVNSSQNKILPNEISRAKTKYLNKGQVQIAENSVRKWDSLLSVIEENYFKS